jgi:hypothetical protein
MLTANFNFLQIDATRDMCDFPLHSAHRNSEHVANMFPRLPCCQGLLGNLNLHMYNSNTFLEFLDKNLNIFNYLAQFKVWKYF